MHKRRGISLVVYALLWPALFAVSTVLFVIRRGFALARGSFSKIRLNSAKKPVALGYIPVELFMALGVLTSGLYPFSWLWSNSAALVGLCGDRLQERRLRLCAGMGFCVQTLLPVSLVLFFAWHFTGDPMLWNFASRFLALYAASFFLLALPQRCYLFFALRWNIRRAVEAWDKDGVMIDRTMSSWLKLFAFGSAYIQYHINRLIGLGMPGFAGQDEIMRDFSVKKWLNEYVIIRHHSIPLPADPGEAGNG
ncbi:MAG: hypothetical protein LBL73_12660 [Synergistaceae bacterium]|nr:hypothetical protein [Synergistaceae bacterium]